MLGGSASGEHREGEGDETGAREAGEEDRTTQLPCGQGQYVNHQLPFILCLLHFVPAVFSLSNASVY